jgi:hypothetical protein
MELPFERRFHFRDGTSVSTLEELKEKLERINYQEFYHHVNTQKNDFASWIRHILKEEPIADDLLKVTSIVETVEILNDHLHPRPITQARADMQSKIEDDVLAHPLPIEADARLPIESVPTTQPSHERPATVEQSDFTIIEEKAGLDAIDAKVKDELFRMPTPTQAPAAPSAPLPAPNAASASPTTAEDHARLIVKDFVYGLIFGLIIGLILGRILTF